MKDLTPVMKEDEAETYCRNYIEQSTDWAKLCMDLPATNTTTEMQACVDDLMVGSSQCHIILYRGF